MKNKQLRSAIQDVLTDKKELQDVIEELPKRLQDDLLRELRKLPKKDGGAADPYNVEKSKGECGTKEHKEHHKKLDQKVDKLVEMEEKEHKKDIDKDGKVAKSDMEKKRGVPEGVDPQKHERCVMDLKQKGHDKESAIRICNDSLRGKIKKGYDASPGHEIKEEKKHDKAREKAKKFQRKKGGIKMKKSWQKELDSVVKNTLSKAFGSKEEKVEKPESSKEEIKKSIIEKYKDQELTDELKGEIREEIKKALAAGYDIAEPAPETLEEVDPSQNLRKPEESEEDNTEKSEESEAKSEDEAEKSEPAAPKYDEGLFSPFSLGATLEQTAHGNVMSNMKPSADNYVERAQNSIKNEVFVEEDLSKDQE